jgi:phosphopantothenoylcysteine synthetase/decarboxylase
MTPAEPLHFLITAGPTREPIDPVRFISNRSSGKMGYAIAEAAARAGHSVDLISGPVAIPAPSHPSVRLVVVESTRQMYEAVAARLGAADVAIMAAAVADYRPKEVSPQKIKKSKQQEWVLHLEKTEDILGSAREPLGFGGLLVGFAAETENLEAHAREKLERKRCDVIVANDVSQPGIGFDADTNEICLFHADGSVEALPRAAKSALARDLVRIIEGLARDRMRVSAS